MNGEIAHPTWETLMWLYWDNPNHQLTDLSYEASTMPPSVDANWIKSLAENATNGEGSTVGALQRVCKETRHMMVKRVIVGCRLWMWATLPDVITPVQSFQLTKIPLTTL